MIVVAAVYAHNTLPNLTMLPRINVDEPWLLERAYQLATTGKPSQPMFLLDDAYLLQPGYGILLAPWIELFGVGLLQARWFSVLCGFGTLAAIFGLGSALFGREVGVVAALLLASDSNFLGAVRTARTEPPALLFIAVALLLALRAARTGSTMAALAAGMSTGAAMLCHANSYWVTLVVLAWYVAAHGFRTFRMASAYAYAAGVLLTFGPYVAIALANWNEFQGQLEKFAIERVPGYSPSVIWAHVLAEATRYRDWYFGLITVPIANPVLVFFQAAAAAGAAYASWLAWARRGSSSAARPETFAACLVLVSAAAFAAFIPNKALIYMPNLLLGYAIVAALVVVRTLQWLQRQLPHSMSAVPVVAAFVFAHAAVAVEFYDDWYSMMWAGDLRPYEETHHVVSRLVPEGPKYLVASPTFWLPFHDKREVRFISYTGAGPYTEPVASGGYARPRSLFELPADRPIYLLVDETEVRAAFEDDGYDAAWQGTWLQYLRRECSLVRVAPGTAHGTIASYACFGGSRAAPVEYLFEGRPLTLDRVIWSARRDRSAAIVSLPPELSVSAQSAVISDAARDSSIDIPVEPGAASLIRVRTVGTPRGPMSLAELNGDGRPGRLRSITGTSNDWFPAGIIIRPGASTVRLYFYDNAIADVSLALLKDP